MSLSQQLDAIKEVSSATVVDRKSRSRIHGRSLIFEAKVAAAQDFEFIYSIGIEGLEELITLDSRFSKFKGTLFHESTIAFDRNVQQREMLTNIDENVNNFLYLVAPYMNLNCSIKALEWLVRRLNINLFNGETLLLILLPYHRDVIFVKILNVIPKTSFPKIFESLLGFKDSLTNPSSISILKGFVNNYQLFKLYTLFMIDQVERKLVFKSQLIFYLSISIQLLSALSKDHNTVEQDYLPMLLKLIAVLLRDSYDNIISAYSLISVISSILLLNSRVVFSLTNAILDNQQCLQVNVVTRTLITLGHLWERFTPEDQGEIRPFQFDIELVESVVLKNHKINKFLTYYFLWNLRQLNVFKYFRFLDLDDANFTLITTTLLQHVKTTDANIKDNITKAIEVLYGKNSAMFRELCGYDIAELEMILMTNLDTNLDIQEQVVQEMVNDTVEDIVEVDVYTTTTTFFTRNSNEFNHLSMVMMSNINSIEGFATKFESFASYISFLIRFSLTTTLPVLARIKVMAKVNKLIKKEVSKGHEYYLMYPLVLLGLCDANKLIRQYYLDLLTIIKSADPKDSVLFLENEIYFQTPESSRSLLAPKDGRYLLDVDVGLDDLVVDPLKITDKLKMIFVHAKGSSKKFGQTHFKGFVLNQWSLDLALCFKAKVWRIMSVLNQENNDYRNFFAKDVNLLFGNVFQKDVSDPNGSLKAVESDLVGLIGGHNTSGREVDQILDLIEIHPELCGPRIIDIFARLKANDAKVKIVLRLIDVMYAGNDTFDGFEVLTEMKLDFKIVLSILTTVQINQQVPEQTIKRKRRSSSQTKQNLARNDVTVMASEHLKKLTIVLDLLDYNLTENLKTNTDDISRPELLTKLFKILTDLDHLGTDGHLPVLYTQEVLANCMISATKLMKSKLFKYDSNSIRSDLIVNSIRNSTNPQIQNRLLLVIAELASLAPEIILHSVMPIFTFMGAHTIKQDDEFSNQALQETVSRVIPALAQNGTTNIDEDIEFLLASFVAALQHIPRHRLNKLFSSLVHTLTVEKSLHVILFLVGTQYTNGINDDVKRMLVEFSSVLLKNFTASEQLASIYKFLTLWETIPSRPLEKNSTLFHDLVKRPVFGVSVLSLGASELDDLKLGLLSYLDEVISVKDEFNEINLLKLKISLDVYDETKENQELLAMFNQIVSALLNMDRNSQVYGLLDHLLDMLPVSFFIDAVIDSLRATDIAIAINFTNLVASKFENELNVNNTTPETIHMIQTKLLPVLVTGLSSNTNVDLQQSYLDAVSVVITKLYVIDNKLFDNSKDLMALLAIVLDKQCLLGNQPELIISSLNLVSRCIEVLGVKIIGLFPKIVSPSFDIWSQFQHQESVVTSVLLLYLSLIKKLSAFLGNSLDRMLVIVMKSDVDSNLRSHIVDMVIQHVDLDKVIKSLCTIWLDGFYQQDSPESLGLFLNAFQATIDGIDKKLAISCCGLFLKWQISTFEFRHYCETNDKFNNNTIYRLESSFYKCAIAFIMKLNDKSFRPLFSSLSRWCINGENAIVDDEVSRYIAFFKFFNKLEQELKSIVTSYYSYLIEPVSKLLIQFATSNGDTNLRRIVLNSLSVSFKYDQDDYWSQELRFELICDPVVSQLANIEDSLGKYLLKAITALAANVSSEEYSAVLANKLITYLSDDNTSQTKIWTIRTLKAIFQKMGEAWLIHLPLLVPYIAELLEDDDEAVELETRNGLIRVIEAVLGEPLNRYLD